MTSHSRGDWRPSCAPFSCPRNKRAQGRQGADRTHGPPATKKAGGSHHRFGLIIRPSLRNGFNGVLRTLPADRAFLPPSPARSLCELDTSVGVSGPHDFAVRVEIVRRRGKRAATQHVHRIPRPTFVTIAKRPSWRARDGADHASEKSSEFPKVSNKSPATRWHGGQFTHGVHAWGASGQFVRAEHGIARQATAFEIVRAPDAISRRRVR
jgi:hypothetical protein